VAEGGDLSQKETCSVAGRSYAEDKATEDLRLRQARGTLHAKGTQDQRLICMGGRGGGGLWIQGVLTFTQKKPRHLVVPYGGQNGRKSRNERSVNWGGEDSGTGEVRSL